MNNFYRVKSQSETFFVQSQKAEGGQVSMCNVVLQELGGKFENQYVATIFGEQARIRFELNDLVAASLRFSTREYNGQTYQDIVVNEIVKLNNLPSWEGVGVCDKHLRWYIFLARITRITRNPSAA